MKESCCAMKASAAVPAWRQKLTLYRPLVVITGVSLLSAVALAARGGVSFMDAAMGMFFIFLAVLKLFNLPAFADTFAKYDVVARRAWGYALAYPFVELAFGGLYLSGLFPVVTNAAVLLVMLLGTVGVAQVIRRGDTVQCACVGTGFNLPVGRVTLAENLVMAAMAAMNLSALVF